MTWVKTTHEVLEQTKKQAAQMPSECIRCGGELEELLDDNLKTSSYSCPKCEIHWWRDGGYALSVEQKKGDK